MLDMRLLYCSICHFSTIIIKNLLWAKPVGKKFRVSITFFKWDRLYSTTLIVETYERKLDGIYPITFRSLHIIQACRCTVTMQPVHCCICCSAGSTASIVHLEHMENAELSNWVGVVKAAATAPLNQFALFPELCAIMCTTVIPVYPQVCIKLLIKNKIKIN